MFSRVTFSVITFLGLACSVTAGAETLSSLLGLGSGSEVATKVAEFKEDLPIGGLAFSAEGTRLAVNPMFAGLDVHIWEWSKQKRTSVVMHNIGAPGEGNQIAYSVDGATIAVGHQRASQQNGFGVIRVWNADSATVAHDITEPAGGDNKGIAFSPDGKYFVRIVNRAGNPGDNLIVYSLDTWSVVWGLRLYPLIPRTLAVTTDGQFAAISGEIFLRDPVIKIHPQIVMVDLAARRIVHTIDGAFPDHNQIVTLAWNPDGKSLAAGAIVQGTFPGPDAVKIFDPENGKQIAGETVKDAAYVNGLAYTADGQYLIEGYIDGHVRIWDSQHTKLLQKIPIDDFFHTVITVSRDSRYLAVGSGKTVLVYRLK